MRRRYKPGRVPVIKPPLQVLQSPTGKPEKWEDGRLLHDLKEASEILTHQLGKGYSYCELSRMLDRDLQEGVHFWRKGRFVKINIHRVIDWQLSQISR